jgi:hypothetical protein
MTRRGLGLLLIGTATACGSASRSPATIGNTPTGDDGAATAAVPCPAGTELEAVARKAWATAAEATVSPECVAVRADRPLWLIHGYAEQITDDGNFVDLHTALVTTGGTTTMLESDTGLPPAAIERGGASYTAVDFDGDGRDELLVFSGYMHGGYEQSWIHARSITGEGKLAATTAPNLPLTSDNTAAAPDPADTYSCLASHQVIDRPGGGHLVEIVAEPATGAVSGQECPAPGRHLYGWDGDKLVEVPGP